MWKKIPKFIRLILKSCKSGFRRKRYSIFSIGFTYGYLCFTPSGLKIKKFQICINPFGVKHFLSLLLVMKNLLSFTLIPFIAGILMAYSGTVCSENVKLDAGSRTHFIVLIRDTGTMNKKHQPLNMIVPTLPKLLFEGEKALGSQTPLNPPLPVYEPNRDHLSVVFVAMHEDGVATECKNLPALSALPKHLFQWQPVVQGQNQASFTQSLQQWITKDCRAQGYVSSSVLAATNILPYVQEKLAQSTLQFSRTILILVGNAAYVGDSLPSEELFELQRLFKVRDTEAAIQIMDKVNSAFHIKTHNDWVFTINPRTQKFERGNIQYGNTLRYRLSKIQPLDNEENFIDYPQTIKLDRVAISKKMLKLVQVGGADIILRILHSERLQPHKLELSFTDKGGGNWQIGKYRLPKTTVIDLNDCMKSNQCQSQVDGVIHVPLFDVVVDNIHLTPDDPAIAPGQIRFKVRFRYNAKDIYTHHFVDTDLKTIDVIPIRLLEIPFFFTKNVLDNKTLAAQYEPSKDSKSGLTPEIARARIGEKQAIRYLFVVIAVVVFSLMMMFIGLQKVYHRRFKPELNFQAQKKIEIDFNRQPGAKPLAGMVVIRNEGKVPWFGKLLGNKDYPDYQVKLFLDYDNDKLREYGFILSDTTPFCFTADKSVSPVGEENISNTSPGREIEYRVSHETPIHIFLATDAITDFQQREAKIVTEPRTVRFGGVDEDIQITVAMWHDDELVAHKDIEFNLELIPEYSKPPQVTYQANTEKLYFQTRKYLNIGTLSFASKTKYHFAEPFKGRFNILTYKNNLPLTSDQVKIADGGDIEILPLETLEREIIVFCDGNTISNPEPRQDYTFDLTGKFAPNSDHGYLMFTLYRDPTRANIQLDIVQFNNSFSIHWQPKGKNFEKHPIVKIGRDNRSEAEGNLLEHSILNLQSNLLKFDENTPAITIFEIHIGNTGKSGKGWIKVNLRLELNFNSYVQKSLKLYQGYSIENLLHIITRDYQGEFIGHERIVIREGEPLEKIIVQVDAAKIIQDIIGGRIDTNQANINALLDIEIQDDEGQHRSHDFTIVAQLGLEKLPHPNWLCIDFGTSAIVTALGIGNKPYFLPLPKVVAKDDPALNFEDYDPSNPERGTDFLPSQVVCDADLRQGETQDESIRKGFPRYQPASLQPGEPDFIGLPATTVRLREQPGRIIYSLKSWLAQPSETISLPESVKFYLLDSNSNIVTKTDEEGNDKPVLVTRNKLPLREVVVSGLAALADGYITALPVFQPGGQVIISHPNTFTTFHKQKLHDIAWQALNKRLGIALPERIRLISESDAVAYHYCRQRMLDNKRKTGEERLLVYDFGAGTLDLSLVQIRWNKEGTYPEQWQVENRLGVPIAGNYLDSLLARLIDKWLREESILEPARFEYQYPVVEKQLKGDSEKELDNHRLAVYRLWQNIREVKHSAEWKEDKLFRVLVGCRGTTDVVRYKENVFFPETEESYNSELVVLEDNIDSKVNNIDSKVNSEKPRLETDGDQIYLHIPAAQVHSDLQEFITFATDTVVDELLQGAEIAAQNVNTVVVSGRGALWPGLRERVWEKFPEQCEKPQLDKNQVKNAVVSGAIAWQTLSEVKLLEPKVTPRLAILREQDNILTTEDEWENEPIDLRSSDTFRLVLVSHRHPNLETDLQSLHRHFYIFLDQIRRDTMWKDDPWLYVRKEERHGQMVIKLNNSQGQGFDFTTVGSISQVSSLPPWPIGTILLEPEV